ncbi:MAG: hypothetical protein ACYTEZ_02095 [Planctomycetota bacterium]
MKKLLIASAIAILVVGGVSLFAIGLLSDFARREQELREVFEERAEDLRATNERFPFAARPTLDPARFQLYLEVRKAVAREFEERIGEHARNTFHARRTHNHLLRTLRLELEKRGMSFEEYRTTGLRWRALLARSEFGKLQEAWRATVSTPKYPDGLPLPPPAGGATPKEIEVVERYARLLEESMHADLLDPLLDEIHTARGSQPD